MLKDRIRQLFANYDPPIQTIIYEVLMLEQEHISMKSPRVKDQIDDIIARVASQELEQADQIEAQE